MNVLEVGVLLRDFFKINVCDPNKKVTVNFEEQMNELLFLLSL